MSDEIIDVTDALERVQDDRELLLELFDIFREDFDKKRKALRELLMHNQLDEFKDIVHSVKGATGNIGAKVMNATCIHLEELARRNDMDALKQQLDQLEQQFGDFQQRAAQIKTEFNRG